MNVIDAAKFLTVSSSLTGREPTEEQAFVWATVLDDIALDEALAALRAHYRVSRFPVMPADIVEHVEAARRQAARDERREKSRVIQRAENAAHRRVVIEQGHDLRDEDVIWPGVGWTGDDQTFDSLSTSIPASSIASRSA